MRVCHIVPSLEKRHGGPSVSVPALALAIGRLGHEVELLSTASGAAQTEVKGPVTAKVFPRSWPTQICASAALRGALGQDEAGIIHHHSLWLRTLHYAHRASRSNQAKLVISPRGMMSPWAWNHHRWRKRFAGACIHPGALQHAHGWHATSAEEAGDIRRLGFTQPVCVAPNGITLPPADQLIAAQPDPIAGKAAR